MLKKYLIATVLVAACARHAQQPAPEAGPAVDAATVENADLAAAAASDLTSASGPPLYDGDGPETWTELHLTASGAGKSFPVVVYLPATAGPRPVVILSSGLQQPAAAYAPYGKRLASWGILAVLRDDPGVLSASAALADDIAFVLTSWLPSAGGALAGRADGAHAGLAGHSRGGQASLLAAEGALHGKLAGFFGLDPVDATPNGGANARAQLASIAIPTAFLGETTDGAGSMACAPSDSNFAVLFAAAPSPSLQITAVGADHTQFEDPAACSFCTLCTRGSADGALVLRASVRYLTAFFARLLLGDARVGSTLDGAGLGSDVAAGLMQSTSK